VIHMMVKVPGELHGASLLKAHGWVKEHVARTNPGGSQDYKLFDGSGNQLTLSDITKNPNSNVNIEVTMLDGVRNNPASMVPIPMMEFEYPDLPRTGNSLTEILPGEIDSALATRIVNEQGLNRGLHTLNRLLHEETTVRPSSATTAALIQISDAVRNNPGVRKNPRTPFTKRAPNFYGAEMALQTWVGDELGARIEASDTTPGILTRKAKVAAKYGLNHQDIDKFATDVLADYLFAASANRGLLRELLRSRPALRADRTTVQKIVAMFPMQPKAFYNGSQRVFVAHPAFMYPTLAAGLMNSRMADAIVSTAENWPDNMQPNRRGNNIPSAMNRYICSLAGRRWRDTALTFISGINPLGSGKSRRGRNDDYLEHMYSENGYWNTIHRRLTQDMHASVRSIGERSIHYFDDIGGFYPAPPPKWPTALIYAIMDTFLENLPYLLNTQGDIASAVMSPMGYNVKKLKLDMKRVYPITITTAGGKEDVRNPTGKELMEALGSEDILGYDNDKGKFKSTKDQILKVHPKSKVTNGQSAGAKESRERARSDIRRALINSLGINDHTQEVIDFNTSGPKSLLEMAYEVTETAQNKYNYTMTGDDFTFVMSIISVSFHRLHETTDGDFFQLTAAGISDAVRKITDEDIASRIADAEAQVRAELPQGEVSDLMKQSLKAAHLTNELRLFNKEVKLTIQNIPSPEATEMIPYFNKWFGQLTKLEKQIEEHTLDPAFGAVLLNLVTEAREKLSTIKAGYRSD